MDQEIENLSETSYQNPKDAYFTYADSKPASTAQKKTFSSMFTNRLGKDLSGARLSNEAILPSQWFDRSAVRRPEHEFLQTILRDAKNVLEKNAGQPKKSNKRLYAETWRWFWEDVSAAVVPFRFVCEHLKLEPDGIRREIAKRFTVEGKKVDDEPRIVYQQEGQAPHVGSAARVRNVSRGYVPARRGKI